MNSRVPSRSDALRGVSVGSADTLRQVREAGIVAPVIPSSGVTRVLLLLADVVALTIAAVTVGHAIAWADGTQWATAVVWTLPLAVVCLLGFALVGLYPGPGMGAVEELRRVVLVASGFHALTLLLFAYTGGVSLGMYLAIGLSWLLMAALPLIARAILRQAFAQRSWWGLPVVVVGGGATSGSVVDIVRENPGLDVKVVGYFDDGLSDAFEDLPRLGSLADIDRVVARLGVRRALVTLADLAPDVIGQLLERHAATLHEIYVVPSPFGPSAIGVAAHGLSGSLVLRSHHHLLFRVNRLAKRILDLTLLLPLALSALPVLVPAILAVLVFSPGNPFYAQRREGYGGRKFDVWKLRTMQIGAEAILEEHLARDPEAREEWQRSFKLKRDPRVLPLIGPLLRRTSVDELPQLWNVAKGEMSLVGPRPFPDYHLEQFNPEFRALRQSVVPGVTGLWQVSVRSDGDLEVQEALDSYYIRNWSVWFDLYLLCRTPIAVLFSRGAY